MPIYAKPDDLVRCTRPDGGTGRGRDRRDRHLRPLLTPAPRSRTARSPAAGWRLAWAADPIDLFFLQIQGSGRLRLPDGQVMRIGYADQNGREYVAIGRLLRDRGILPPGGANMEAIVAWMRAQPDGGRALMRENLSYIFFKELTGPGPLGALGVPVTRRATVAADPKFVPLGAPVFLTLDRPEAYGPVGRAGHRRSDQGRQPLRHLLGRGRGRASATAGGMSAKGQALILLPKGVGGACAASPLTKPRCGRGSPRPSGRCRASRSMRRDVAEAAGSSRVANAAKRPSSAAASAAICSASGAESLQASTLDGGWDRRLEAGRDRARPDRSTFTATTSTAPGRRSTGRWSARSPPASGCCC